MTLMLLFFYGTAIIWMTYLLSFMFHTSFNGQTFVFVLSYLFAVVLMVLGFGFRMLPQTSDVWMNWVENILMIVPLFSFSMGFLNVTMIDVYSKYFNWTITSAFDSRIASKFLLSILSFSLISFLLLILIEYKNYIKFAQKKAIDPKVEQTV